MIRLIIADDHTLFRLGQRQMLESFGDLQVVAEASDSATTQEAVTHVSADALIMDLTMPGVAGVSLIDAVHGIAPKMPILILSMHDEPVTVRRALQAGASGYITKESTPDVLYTAITRVAAGERYIASNVAEQLAFEAVNQENIDAHRALSPREWEVLRLITEGLMLSQIADRLHLSPKTITTHKTHLMEKLGIDNNADLIRYAIENRLFE